LDAVVWPQGNFLFFNFFTRRLWVANGVLGDKGLCSRVLAGEGAMIARVAVLGGEDGLEGRPEQPVDDGDDLAGVLDGECSVLLSLA